MSLGARGLRGDCGIATEIPQAPRSRLRHRDGYYRKQCRPRGLHQVGPTHPKSDPKTTPNTPLGTLTPSAYPRGLATLRCLLTPLWPALSPGRSPAIGHMPSPVAAPCPWPLRPFGPRAPAPPRQRHRANAPPRLRGAAGLTPSSHRPIAQSPNRPIAQSPPHRPIVSSPPRPPPLAFIRHIALEFLLTIAENSPTMARKLDGFVTSAVPVCAGVNILAEHF